MSDQYPSNSHASASPRPPREKQRAVVTNVHLRKKSLGVRIAERGTGIWKDVLFEVIGPYFRDMFADSFYAAIDRAFYPDAGFRSRTGGSPRPGGGRQPQQVSAAGYIMTDYNSQYQSSGGPASVPYDPRDKPFDFSIFGFSEYAQGRELIDRLSHGILTYGHATVNDLYDLFGKSSVDHTGENYGWDSLDAIADAQVRRVRGGKGYFLDIPDAKPLKK